jgi:hypothetical protein
VSEGEVADPVSEELLGLSVALDDDSTGGDGAALDDEDAGGGTTDDEVSDGGGGGDEADEEDVGSGSGVTDVADAMTEEPTEGRLVSKLLEDG